MSYWLVKSEPETFSFDDLMAADKRTTNWDGIRNFTARNHLRDGMKTGDRVFFYHSNANPPAIVGICEVVRAGYPEKDEKWFQVDLKAIARLRRPVTLPEIKAEARLKDMVLVKLGRLSVSPVTDAEWETVLKLAAVGS